MNCKSSNKIDLTFAQQYEITKENFINIPINTYSFSQRTKNCFASHGITTVYSLLSSSRQSLLNIKGFGNNCLNEIEKFCITLKKSTINNSLNNKEKIVSCFKSILTISTTNTDLSSYYNKEIISFCTELINLLGKDFISLCINNSKFVISTITLLCDSKKIFKLQLEIKETFDSIHSNRKNNKVYPYILAFTIVDEERYKLQKLCKNENTTLYEMMQYIPITNNHTSELLLQFLKWYTFNINDEIEEIINKTLKITNSKQIINERAQKFTLEKIGKELGLTRERVRQIEAKTIKIFSTYYKQYRIIHKISAEQNGEQILLTSTIEKYCNQYSQEFLFFLQHYENTSYTYDELLDSYILGDDSITEQIIQCIDTFPDLIKKEQLQSILLSATQENNIPIEILENAFLNIYKLSENIYYRNKLHIESILQNTIEKYYSNGLKVYDTEEMKKFRQHIILDYGNISLPQNDRALASRIMKICILCNKGTYKIKQNKHLSHELIKNIHEHILNNNNPILRIASLFNIFKNELSPLGVDNKYYFQGILHKLFSNEFLFKKDYIFKDPSFTFVYSSIIEYIKQSSYPVTKTQLQEKFPEITEAVISLATNSTPNILNFFGEYFWAGKLSYFETEKNYIQNLIDKIIRDQNPHHVKEIFEIINLEKPEILKRNAIRIPFSAFSFLEYLFKDNYQFSRPYIALKNMDIGQPADRLHDLIYSSDEFEIIEIRKFAKQNHYQIQSILDFVTTYNVDYLLINSSTIMKIDKIGITSNLAKDIDEFISTVIKEPMPIKELQIWHKLPQLKISWTDWLLFSILKKWGEKVSVATSSAQLRNSVPLIAPLGKMDLTTFMKLKPIDNFKIDNGDDIDSLLEDIIDDIILDETNEF